MEQNSCRDKWEYVERVIAYMGDHLKESLTLRQLAREAGLSESYLNVVFKECIRRAPMDYYINMKMDQACRLLCTTDLRVCQVAGQLGYDNQYYFSRAFKKVMGLSPKAYKENSLPRSLTV